MCIILWELMAGIALVLPAPRLPNVALNQLCARYPTRVQGQASAGRSTRPVKAAACAVFIAERRYASNSRMRRGLPSTSIGPCRVPPSGVVRANADLN